MLRAGARLSNGSVEVGQLRAAKGDEVDLYDVQLLETKGGRARIKIAGDNPLTVWVDARDIDAEVAADPSTASA